MPARLRWAACESGGPETAGCFTVGGSGGRRAYAGVAVPRALGERGTFRISRRSVGKRRVVLMEWPKTPCAEQPETVRAVLPAGICSKSSSNRSSPTSCAPATSSSSTTSAHTRPTGFGPWWRRLSTAPVPATVLAGPEPKLARLEQAQGRPQGLRRQDARRAGRRHPPWDRPHRYRRRQGVVHALRLRGSREVIGAVRPTFSTSRFRPDSRTATPSRTSV